MTITPHWWALPLAVALFGLVVLIWPRKSGGGYVDLSGLENLAVFFLCLVVAVGICVGHWL